MNTEEIEKKQVMSQPNYEVTKDGRVFRISTGKEMTLAYRDQHNYPYISVRTCHNNKASNVKVARMVAEAWLPKPDNPARNVVNHINGNSLDNRVENLEWCTGAENQKHAVQSGLKGKGDDLYNSQLSEEQVHEACRLLMDKMVVKDIAERFNVSKDIIRKLRAGDTYFHIRVLYPIDHTYLNEFSVRTVEWVCQQVIDGFSDKKISQMSTNSNLTIIDIKRIRYGIRYSDISKSYFKDSSSTTNLYGVGSKLLTPEMEDPNSVR